jgi:hypothetical protein
MNMNVEDGRKLGDIGVLGEGGRGEEHRTTQKFGKTQGHQESPGTYKV